MDITKKNIIKILKVLFSRVGSMVIFSAITSLIIYAVTMHDHLDELTNNITTANFGNISSNVLDANSSLSAVMAPLVEKNIITDSQQVPFSIVEEFSPYLDEGQTSICPGTPGQIVTQYEQITVNGKLVTTNQLSGNEIKPRPQRILIGIRKPINTSPFSNSIALDNDGRPLNYELLLCNRVATAYTADYGARTSTGKFPRVGYVAVNPKVIPYHSILYIQCLGNNFAGVFVAEDTGGAMRKGHADIDVFMQTKNQCLNFGRQRINIYVLCTNNC